MFFMSMLTAPPAEVAAVLVPAGALVAGAGWLDEDLSFDEPPQPAATSATMVAASRAIRVMSGTLHLKLHEHGGVVGERTAVENARLADRLQAPGQHVVDAASSGPGAR